MSSYDELPHALIEAKRQDLDDATQDYLRSRGWKATCNTPGSYWMWEKNVTGLEYYDGDTRHNRLWLVNRDDAFRLQSYWDGEQFAAEHPDQVED